MQIRLKAGLKVFQIPIELFVRSDGRVPLRLERSKMGAEQVDRSPKMIAHIVKHVCRYDRRRVLLQFVQRLDYLF